LKERSDVTDLKDPGRLFQSEGALNLKAHYNDIKKSQLILSVYVN